MSEEQQAQWNAMSQETPTEATITPEVAHWETLSQEERAQLNAMNRQYQNERNKHVAELSSPSNQRMDREGSECCPCIECEPGSCGTHIIIVLPKNCCVACACLLPLCAIETAYDLACLPAYCGVLCCQAYYNESQESD
jgi:hypothetical protein